MTIVLCLGKDVKIKNNKISNEGVKITFDGDILEKFLVKASKETFIEKMMETDESNLLNIIPVILSINERICALNEYGLKQGLQPEEENLKKLFSIFERLNHDPEHYLYSIKTLKENLK